MIVLLQLLFLVCSVAGFNISLTSGELCEGAIATWTCVIDGASVGWRNLGETAFPALNPNLVPLGSGSPFSSTITSITNGIITSIARANLTIAVNGSLLECSNDGFSSPTENVTLIFKDPVAANLITPVFFDNGIRVSWSGATCAGSYRLSVYLSVYEVNVTNVIGTTYDFIPKAPGEYSFELTTIDYLGNDIGSTNSMSIVWKEPKFFVEININNSIANFTFKNNDDERPPVTNCSITFDGVLKSCVIDSNIVIFNILSGAKHSYNINITNAVGTVNMNGELSNEVYNRTVTIEVGASIDPVVIAAPPAALGILIILIGFWMVLRICWKRQCCCPRIWRSSFWLIFFCYDCCTYDTEVKERNTIGLKNPNIGGEKGNDTPL